MAERHDMVNKAIRDLEREAELDVIAGAPAWVRPLILRCPHCEQVEPHTKFNGGGPWLLVCWGCDEMREEMRG